MTNKTMRAVVLAGHGDLDKLVFRGDYPKPEPGRGEVLIRVGACGLNNTDVNTRTAWYSQTVTGATTGGALSSAKSDDAAWGGKPISFPRVQGADAVGTVVETGEGADKSLVGKRVMIDCWLRDWNEPENANKTGYFGSECDGGFAEYATVDARNVYPVNSEWSDAELATFSTSYSTAENMLNRAAVGGGDIVLITGASGGVGSALIQLANRRGAKTVAMCGAEKAEAVRALNPAAILPRAPDDLRAELQKAIGASEVTVAADVVGGEYWKRIINALARRGRYVCSGAIAGPIVEFDLRVFYLRDLTLLGSTVPPPGAFADVVRYIERGEVRPLLAQTFPLEKLREAQRAFIAKKHFGNIAVTVGK